MQHKVRSVLQSVRAMWLVGGPSCFWLKLLVLVECCVVMSNLQVRRGYADPHRYGVGVYGDRNFVPTAALAICDWFCSTGI